MSTEVPAPARRAQPAQDAGGWYGWVAFASVMMVLLGTFHVVAGLVGLFKEEYYLVGQDDLVVSVDYTLWGLAHLLLGAIIVTAGLALLKGALWARIVAVVLAAMSAVANLAFMAAYPLWATLMIAIDLLVIYAVVARGDPRSLGLD